MATVRLLCVALIGLVLVGCGDGATGAWSLDKDKTFASLEAEMKKQLGENVTKEMVDAAKAQMGTLDLTLDVRQDKTFTATMTVPMLGDQSINGEWKKEDSAYVFTGDKGETIRAKLEGGRLVFTGMDPRNPTQAMYLKRK